MNPFQVMPRLAIRSVPKSSSAAKLPNTARSALLAIAVVVMAVSPALAHGRSGAHHAHGYVMHHRATGGHHSLNQVIRSWFS
jgi:hypothetical protein